MVRVQVDAARGVGDHAVVRRLRVDVLDENGAGSPGEVHAFDDGGTIEGAVALDGPDGPRRIRVVDAKTGTVLLDKNGDDPAFPFGFGLSYTTFVISNLKLEGQSVPADGVVHASVDVSNTGAAAGKAVVELYVGAQGSSVERAVRELEGFTKLALAPGETKNVSFAVPAEDLAYFDVSSGKFVVEPVGYRLWVGSSSRDLPQSVDFTITN